MLALDNKRIDDNRYCILCCIKSKTDPNDEIKERQLKYKETSDDENIDITVEEEICYECSISWLCGRSLLKCLSFCFCRWVVIAIFIAIEILAIFATLNMGVGTDQTNMYLNDSFIKDYYTDLKNAFCDLSVNEISLVYNNKDISDKIIRNEFINMFKEYKNLSYIIDINEWVTEFINYVDNIDEQNSDTIYNQLNTFLHDNEYKKWNNEIILNENNTKIKYGKLYLTAYIPTDINKIWSYEEELLNILKTNMNDYTEDTYVHNDMFTYAYIDGNIINILIKNILISVGSVGIILLFLLDFRQAIFMSIIVCIINIILCCWMYIYNINLNTITYITLIISVSLTINYVIHIINGITNAKPKDGYIYSERIKIAYNNIGNSIIKGTFTTTLSIIPLLWTNTDSIKIFCIILFGIIIILIFHALILTSALLGELYCLYNRTNDQMYQLPSLQMEAALTTTTAAEASNVDDYVQA